MGGPGRSVLDHLPAEGFERGEVRLEVLRALEDGDLGALAGEELAELDRTALPPITSTRPVMSVRVVASRSVHTSADSSPSIGGRCTT